MSDEINQIAVNLPSIALATGALGAAAFGVVDGLKFFPWFSLSGFECLFSGEKGGRRTFWFGRQGQANLDPLLAALEAAYGSQTMEVLKSQYLGTRAQGDLPRTLRQGVRIGIDMMTKPQVAEMCDELGISEPSEEIAAAVEKARSIRPPAAGEAAMEETGPGVDERQRSALARLATTIDARIDAALVLAEQQYVAQARVWAMLLALVIALATGFFLVESMALAFLVGVTAVPLAPVAKDLATGLQEAVKALRRP